MTTYVLLEQGDWFEDEIKFIRKLVQPGMRCLDIGSNYGVYTLAMSRAAGPQGRIWSIEPNREVAPFLRWSVSHNHENNILYLPIALSDHDGQAWLTSDENSELGMIVSDQIGNSKPVILAMLDRIMDRHELYPIDFVKIDVEGHEGNVISGGGEFFRRNSPLVMYEIKQGVSFNTSLVAKFRNLGYDSYRLIPGLDLLVPYNDNETLDVFQLNLFCCKQDRAGMLEADGYLTGGKITAVKVPVFDAQSCIDYFSRYVFSGDKMQDWSRYLKNVESELEYKLALNYYIKAHNDDASPVESYALLVESRKTLEKLITVTPFIAGRLTYARIIWELGQRSDCIEIMNKTLSLLERDTNWCFDIPFIPVSPAFENINPDRKYRAWTLASILAQLNEVFSFSSYFQPRESLAMIKQIKNLGFSTADLDRKEKLIEHAFDHYGKLSESHDR
jgi:FkbM family methyltransferase